MIISFKHKGLEVFYRTGSTKGIQSQHAKKLEGILTLLDTANSPNDLIFLYKFHKLTGDLEGYFSMSVSGNWRIIFKFVNENVELVDYLDYH